jgi:hypothetical protein
MIVDCRFQNRGKSSRHSIESRGCRAPDLIEDRFRAKAPGPPRDDHRCRWRYHERLDDLKIGQWLGLETVASFRVAEKAEAADSEDRISPGAA